MCGKYYEKGTELLLSYLFNHVAHTFSLLDWILPSDRNLVTRKGKLNKDSLVNGGNYWTTELQLNQCHWSN